MARLLIRVQSRKVQRQMAEAYASGQTPFFARETHASQALRLTLSVMPSGSAVLLTMIISPCAATSTQVPPLHRLLRRHANPSASLGFNVPPIVTADVHPYGHYAW